VALTNDQAQKVRLLLQSNGWQEVVLPAIRNRGQQAVKALVMGRAERAATFKGSDFDVEDEVLRAIIRDCEWMSVVWTNELLVSEHNQRLDELDRNNSGGAANLR
jgi:hypothetical protein